MKNITSLLVALLVALLIGTATAAGTPADTEITNQASASYIDSAGQPRTTSSNQVITVVQQVYSVGLSPDGTTTTPGQTKRALPGAPVYFNYRVANGGNGSDTIALSASDEAGDDFQFASGASFYRDANCNGTIDAGESTAVASVTLAADESACVIVEATIPASADGVLEDHGDLDVTGTSAGGPSDSGNVARAVATNAASMTLSKAVTPGGTVSAGDTLAYTLSGANAGGAAASGVDLSSYPPSGSGLLLLDTLPADATFVAGSLSGSAGAGTVTPMYQTSSGWTTTEPVSAASVTAVGMAVVGSGAFFPQGASYELSFSVTVDAGLAAGTAIENSAVLDYNDGSADRRATSNTTSSKVAATYSALVGPYTDPAADGSFTASDPYTFQGWQVDIESATNDRQSIATATTPVYTGDTVAFLATLRNGGNAADSFTLAFSDVPSGWTCVLRQADGTTPLSGAVGPLDAGSDFAFSVHCSLPEANTNASATPQDVTVGATSVGGSGSDTTTLRVPAVLAGYGVNVTDQADGETLTGIGTDPATTVSFPLKVANTGANADTYSLTAAVPAGWSALFRIDANCDGSADGAATTDTGLLAAGGAACFIAEVQVPAGTAPGADTATFTATSTTDGAVSDALSGTVTVNTVAALAFDPDRSGTVTTPGVIAYTHTLTNNGNDAATVAIPAFGGAHGWTYQFSTDGGTSWSSSVSGLALAAGASQALSVRVIVPSGQPVGRTEAAVFTATATYAGGSATDTATDTTAVVGGDLTLAKSVRTCADAACGSVTSADGSRAEPGEYLEYTVAVDNIGTADLSQVIVADPLPAYTDFVSLRVSLSGWSGTLGVDHQLLFSLDGASWNTAVPSPAAGQSIYLGVDTDMDGTLNASDTMSPSAALTMTLVVRVR